MFNFRQRQIQAILVFPNSESHLQPHRFKVVKYRESLFFLSGEEGLKLQLKEGFQTVVIATWEIPVFAHMRVCEDSSFCLNLAILQVCWRKETSFEAFAFVDQWVCTSVMYSPTVQYIVIHSVLAHNTHVGLSSVVKCFKPLFYNENVEL